MLADIPLTNLPPDLQPAVDRLVAVIALYPPPVTVAIE